jgi:hypothetical protein
MVYFSHASSPIISVFTAKQNSATGPYPFIQPELCDSPDRTTHYEIPGIQVEEFSLTRNLSGHRARSLRLFEYMSIDITENF